MEELTKKMHSEFQVSSETDTKHTVWALLSMSETTGKSIVELLPFYELTLADVEKYKASYFELNK